MDSEERAVDVEERRPGKSSVETVYSDARRLESSTLLPVEVKVEIAIEVVVEARDQKEAHCHSVVLVHVKDHR